jgi:hypothetical protein
MAERIEFLDGLRGVAATLVLIGHVGEELYKAVGGSFIDTALDVEKPMIRLGKELIRRGRRAPISEGIEPAP